MAPRACYPDRATTVNALLDTLCDDTRREVVYFFEQAHDTDVAQLDSVVSYLDAETPGVNPDEIRVRLVHNHLPKLAERNWLDFDPETERIRYYGHDTVAEIMADLCDVFE